MTKWSGLDWCGGLIVSREEKVSSLRFASLGLLGVRKVEGDAFRRAITRADFRPHHLDVNTLSYLILELLCIPRWYCMETRTFCLASLSQFEKKKEIHQKTKPDQTQTKPRTTRGNTITTLYTNTFTYISNTHIYSYKHTIRQCL